MFTPVEHFDDCYASQLEYLLNTDEVVEIENERKTVLKPAIAQHYVPSYDVNRTTGKYEECETMAAQQFIVRYNLKAIKRMDKVTDYMEDPNIQEYLQALNVDSEKFWYLLLFVYDYSFGQCVNNIVTNKTPKEEIENLIKNIENGEEPVVLQVGKVPLDGIITSFIADACKKYLEVCGDSILLNTGSLNLDKRNNVGFTRMAYHFCYMFKWFFDWIGIERKEGAIFSNNEKGLLCHLLHLTEICTRENLLKYRENDYSTLKGFIKPKTIIEFNAMNSYYYG